MLVIRMQRVGRKKLAHYRVVVQDSRTAPLSGKVIAQLGSHDPHNKTTKLNKEEAQRFLDHGAQPSDRAAKLLKSEGVKLPKWVKIEKKTERATKNPDKLRKNQPAEETPAEKPEAPEAEVADASDTSSEEPAAENTDAPAEEEKPAEEKTEETPAEEEPKEEKPAEEAAEPKAEEAPTEEVKEEVSEEAPKEEPNEEKPSEETPKEEAKEDAKA